MRIKEVIVIVLIAVSVLGWSFGRKNTGEASGHEIKYALILEGAPIAIKPLKPPAASDAVEDVPGFAGLTQIVTFRIEKIVKGRLEKIRSEPRSATAQIREAIAERDYLNVLNYDTQTVEFQKQRFRVAVTDAKTTFGFHPEDDLEKLKYRLYFHRYKKEATTFILVKSEKIFPPATPN